MINLTSRLPPLKSVMKRIKKHRLSTIATDLLKLPNSTHHILDQNLPELKNIGNELNDPDFIFGLSGINNIQYEDFSGQGGCSIISYLFAGSYNFRYKFDARLCYTNGHVFNMVTLSNGEDCIVDGTWRQFFHKNACRKLVSTELGFPPVLILPLSQLKKSQEEINTIKSVSISLPDYSYDNKSGYVSPEKYITRLEEHNINTFPFKRWLESA